MINQEEADQGAHEEEGIPTPKPGIDPVFI
jgi:hypothetical protein